MSTVVFYIVAIVFVAFSPPASADVISLRSDYWCPYICDPKSDKPGYMVEVVRNIFEKKGHTVDIQLTNWVRAVKEARANKIQGILGCGRADVPEFVFPEHALGVMKNAYFTKSNSDWVYRGRASLHKMRIGVINGYTYGDSIDQMILSRHKSFIPFSGDRPLKQIMRMIEERRLDAFVENPVALHYALKEMDIPASSLKVAGWVATGDPYLYVSFSPSHAAAEEYAQILSRGIEEIRQTGELQRIFDKYGIEDWEKQKVSLSTLDNFSPRILKSPLDLLYMFNAGDL